MIIGYILLLIALAEVGLGIWLLTKYQKNQATFWYGLFAIGVAMYVASNGFGYIIHAISGGFNERIGWVGGVILTSAFLAFSYSFPLARKKWSELFPWVIWPFAIFVPGFFLTNVFIKQNGLLHYGAGGYQTDPGPYLWFFLIFYGVYWLWAMINMATTWSRTDGVHRWQVKVIALGTLTSLIIGTVFDVVIPLFTAQRYGYVGSLFTSVWLGVTSYIILKK